jgi:hypothetical protein
MLVFLLNGDGCKAPELTASINVVGDTSTKRLKKIGNYNRALKLSTEDLASFLERDQVLLPFSGKLTSNPTMAAAPARVRSHLVQSRRRSSAPEKGKQKGIVDF